ncbi:MAG: hypothetical protein MUF64_02540 [Polyangiaceae bacterium]|nr:hypothetical protein [Polyangiaceae bacterium]
MKPYRLLLAAWPVVSFWMVLAACGSSTSSDPPAGSGGSAGSVAGQGGSVNAGAGGDAGTTSAGAAGNAGGAGSVPLGAVTLAEATPLCQQACATVQTCDPKADTAACQAQCIKEVTGDGYLWPEVAVKYFEDFRDAKTDTDCRYTAFGKSWERWSPDTPPPDKFDKLLDQPTLLECMKYTEKCYAANFDIQRQYYCFNNQYAFNKDSRQKVRDCMLLDAPCATRSSCITASLPQGEPWLVGRSGDPGQ